MLPESTPENAQALLLFQVGPVYCCAPTDPVQAVVLPPRMHRPAGTGAGEPGVFEHGKLIVKVIDLRQRFGVDPGQIGSGGRVIITEHDGEAFGFWVDEVMDVVPFPNEGWARTPAFVPREVFARTLLMDERVFLYSEFGSFTELDADAGLLTYLQRLAGEQRTTAADHTAVAADPDADPGEATIDSGGAESNPPESSLQQSTNADTASGPATATGPCPAVSRQRLPDPRGDSADSAPASDSARVGEPSGHPSGQPKAEREPVAEEPDSSPTNIPAAAAERAQDAQPEDGTRTARRRESDTVLEDQTNEAQPGGEPEGASPVQREPESAMITVRPGGPPKSAAPVPAPPVGADVRSSPDSHKADGLAARPEPASTQTERVWDGGGDTSHLTGWLLGGVAALVLAMAGLSYQLLLPESSSSKIKVLAPATRAFETATAAPATASNTQVTANFGSQASAELLEADAGVAEYEGGSNLGNNDEAAPARETQADASGGLWGNEASEPLVEATPETGSGLWGDDTRVPAGEATESSEPVVHSGSGLWGDDTGKSAGESTSDTTDDLRGDGESEPFAETTANATSALWGDDTGEPSSQAAETGEPVADSGSSVRDDDASESVGDAAETSASIVDPTSGQWDNDTPGPIGDAPQASVPLAAASAGLWDRDATERGVEETTPTNTPATATSDNLESDATPAVEDRTTPIATDTATETLATQFAQDPTVTGEPPLESRPGNSTAPAPVGENSAAPTESAIVEVLEQRTSDENTATEPAVESVESAEARADGSANPSSDGNAPPPVLADTIAQSDAAATSNAGYRAFIERDEHGVIITLHGPDFADEQLLDGAAAPTNDEAIPARDARKGTKPADDTPEATATTGDSSPSTHRRVSITHVVVKGDTLWHIAERYVDDPFRYPELARLSNISDPDWIYPGDLVRIVKYVRAGVAEPTGDKL